MNHSRWRSHLTALLTALIACVGLLSLSSAPAWAKAGTITEFPTPTGSGDPVGSRPGQMAISGSPCPLGTASSALPPVAAPLRSPCPRGAGSNLAASRWGLPPGRMATYGSPSPRGTRLGASPHSRARVNTNFKLGKNAQLKVCIYTHDFMLLSTLQYMTTSPCLPLSHFRIWHISSPFYSPDT